MKYCSILFLFFVLTLAGCGEKSVTLPEQPLSTNPKDYLWSGKTGSEYTYDGIHTLLDSIGKDTSYLAYTDRYIIDDDDTLLPNGIRGKRVRWTRSYPDTSFTYRDTSYYYAVDGRLMRTDLPMPSIPKDTDTLLMGVMTLGTNVQLSSRFSVHSSLVTSVSQAVNTPNGTYRSIVTELDIDTFQVLLGSSSGSIIGSAKGQVLTYYSPGLYAVRVESNGQFLAPFTSQWRSSKFVHVLRSASIK